MMIGYREPTCKTPRLIQSYKLLENEQCEITYLAPFSGSGVLKLVRKIINSADLLVLVTAPPIRRK
jgi:hypothetical protein